MPGECNSACLHRQTEVTLDRNHPLPLWSGDSILVGEFALVMRGGLQAGCLRRRVSCEAFGGSGGRQGEPPKAVVQVPGRDALMAARKCLSPPCRLFTV